MPYLLYPTCFLILGCWRTHLHQSLQGWSGGWLGVQWCSWWPGSPIRVILGFNCVDNLAAGGWCIVVITLRPRQNGRHFTECIFLNENYCISIQILRKCVSMGPIITMLALVQIIAWIPTVDKPLSESMMVYFSDAYMRHLWPLLLTWFNFNPSMDKLSHPL